MPNILRLPAVVAKTGLSASTIQRYGKAGKFPRRMQLGPNSVGWVVEEVDAWLERQDRVGSQRTGLYVMGNEWGTFIPVASAKEARELSQAMWEAHWRSRTH